MLLPFAVKGTLHVALNNKYGKGEREHIQKKAWTPTEVENSSSRTTGKGNQTKETDTREGERQVVPVPLPPTVLRDQEIDHSTETQCM